MVASGKGGTGKTYIAASLAKVLAPVENISFFDADVEEPNALLFLGPAFGKADAGREVQAPDFQEELSVPVPSVNDDKCTACGKCVEACSFNALVAIGGHVLFYSHLCHSCGACFTVCPEGALVRSERRIGVVTTYRFASFLFCEGRIDVGEAKASPLIEDLSERAGGEAVSIIDSPPGVSCSMLAAVKKADFCILVSENTPFGLHDLEAAVEVMYSLSLPFAVILNKWQPGYTAPEEFIKKENIPLLLKIPFSARLAGLYSKQLLIDEFDESLTGKLKEAGMKIIAEIREKQ